MAGCCKEHNNYALYFKVDNCLVLFHKIRILYMLNLMDVGWLDIYFILCYILNILCFNKYVKCVR